jgi:dsDNA-binding SOS-regulon protein
MFEEDIEHTPARFFPMPNQTTPTWCEKVRALEKINPRAPDYTIVSTIKYLHALDFLYEDQQQQLSGWITKAKEIGDELRNTNLELFLARQEKAILKLKLDSCRQELVKALQRPRNKKRARRMKNRGQTFDRRPIAVDTGVGVPAYDP